MKKSTLSIAAALYSLTALTAPAHANDFGRLGIGLGVAILGKMIEGAGNSHSTERHRDRSERADRGTSGKTRNSEAVASVDPAIILPAVGPMIEARPDPASVIVADAASADGTDPTTTAAVDQPMPPTPAAIAAAPVVVAANIAPPVAAPTAEVADIEMVDENGRSWGLHTKSEKAKASQLASLGMNLSDAYEAAGFKLAPVVAPVDDTVAMVDEKGRDWGRVPAKTADLVKRGIALGMVPSKAFVAIAKLKDPDQVKAEADAKVVEAAADESKIKASCLERGKSMPTTKWTECRPYQAEIDAAYAQIVAKDCAAKLDEVTHAKRASIETVCLNGQSFDKLFGSALPKPGQPAAPDASNKLTFDAKPASNNAPAAPIVDAKPAPAVDANTTAAVTPEAPKVAPVATPAPEKPKLDVSL